VDPKLSFPFMSSLTDGMKHVCRGALIAPDIVLTLSHCAQSFGAVPMNRYNIYKTIVNHPEYCSNFHADSDPHDVAVVKLFGSFQIHLFPLMKEE